jgi:hypothetical protein
MCTYDTYIKKLDLATNNNSIKSTLLQVMTTPVEGL